LDLDFKAPFLVPCFMAFSAASRQPFSAPSLALLSRRTVPLVERPRPNRVLPIEPRYRWLIWDRRGVGNERGTASVFGAGAPKSGAGAASDPQQFGIEEQVMAAILLWLSGIIIVVLVTMICARRNREAFEARFPPISDAEFVARCAALTWRV
jgi:hypothetical protein